MYIRVPARFVDRPARTPLSMATLRCTVAIALDGSPEQLPAPPSYARLLAHEWRCQGRLFVSCFVDWTVVSSQHRPSPEAWL